VSIQALTFALLAAPKGNTQTPQTLKPTPKTVAWGLISAEDLDALVKPEDMTHP